MKIKLIGSATPELCLEIMPEVDTDFLHLDKLEHDLRQHIGDVKWSVPLSGSLERTNISSIVLRVPVKACDAEGK